MSTPTGTPKRSARASSAANSPAAPLRDANDDQNPNPAENQNVGTPRRTSRANSVASSRASSRNSKAVEQNAAEPSSDLLPLPSSPICSGNTTATSDVAIPNTSPVRAANAADISMSSPLNYGTPSSVGSIRTPRSLVSGTPLRQRTDIRTDRRVRQVQVGSSDVGDGERAQSVAGSDTGARAGPQLVIWGTNVVVNACKEQFKKFVRRFINAEIEEIQEPLYLQKLAEIQLLEEPFFNLNCLHLQQFDPDLYRQLISYPQEVIPTFDMAINDMFAERYPDTVLPHQIQVRPFNADKTKNMRYLNPEDIDQLLTISGMVIRVSNIIPEMREAFFRCSVCSRSATVEIDRGRIVEPVLCAGCNSGHAFSLIHNRSQFTDKQMIKLQESPDDMPPGQTPHTIVLYAHNDLVDTVQPGDRVHVTGIYRAVPMRAKPRQRTMKAVYKTHIDVVHFHKVDEKRLREDNEEVAIEFSSEQIEGFKKLSRQPDIYDKLARALAPSIYENEDIKKGILLLLFGGTKKDFVNTGRGKFRSEINLLLCGDPGTSKSQLLQFVYHLVPRGQYTSGKGSSAVGLTAYITRDPETRQPVLQTGALVLSDNGVCCIDEFDKMNDSTRSVLHEVMEQQTLSIAKAGIVCQLNARTSVLAAANPCESQWNKNKTVLENVKLPHTLMSRFDLIFLMLDPQNEIFDRRLARHLVSIYYRSKESEPAEHMDLSVLKDYISYAKSNIKPKLSDEAGQQLIQAYLDMRRIGNGRGQISAYPRQLESLIRLSEAHAKIRLSQFVETADVDEAIRIYREALKQSATDPMSGKIDVSILASGVSSAVRQRRVEVAKTLKKMIQSKSYTGSLSTVKAFKELKEQMDIQLTREMFEDALKDLQDDDFLVVASKNYVRIC